MPEVLKCSVQEMRHHLILNHHLVCENNPQTRENIIKKEMRQIAQEMLNRVVDNFIVRVVAVLSYSSAVHGTNIVLITEKV